MVFKIHGERNSGTKFLTNLFEANFKFAPFQENYVNENCYYWKHGTNLNKFLSDQIDIFIVRSLDEWLISMFYKPYHLKQSNDFFSFLSYKQLISDNWTKDGHLKEVINFEDKDKDIFEIRYFKLKKIFDYCNNNTNIIIVSLDYLQKPANAEKFLRDVNKIYNLNKTDKFISSLKYKRNYYPVQISNFKKIIDSQKNGDIEKFINNLTYIIKYSPR